MAQCDSAVTGSSGFAWAERLGSAVADLLFPPHCVVCHRFGDWLCAGCLNEISEIRPPLCHRCGLPMPVSEEDQVSAPSALVPTGVALKRDAMGTCHHCRRTSSQLDGLRAYALHGGPLRKAIHAFKYDGLRSLAPILGGLMGQGWAAVAPGDLEIDVIAPVPLHASRQQERGFNQAALLGRELSMHLRRPIVEGTLIRTKPTSPQVGLSPEERQANVYGAFQCVGEELAGMRVLLVDDVYTTGSTMEAACAALLEAGVESIWAYTLARAGADPASSSYS